MIYFLIIVLAIWIGITIWASIQTVRVVKIRKMADK